MFKSRSSHGKFFAAMSLCALGTAMLVGCADVVTTAGDSQRTGIKLYNDKSYAEAAGAFRNSIRQDPRQYKSYYYLGACYEQMGQYQQAIQAYKQGRSAQNTSLIGKDDVDFRIRLIDGEARAIARSDSRDIETDAALQQANTTSSATSWFVLAKIYSYRGDADSAIDAFNRACLLAPNEFAYAKEYGLYLEKVGQPQQAVVPLRRAYALNPKDEQVIEALRRAGIVPGPSLRDESALAKPPIPKGPIPQLELKGTKVSGSDTSPAAPGGVESAPND